MIPEVNKTYNYFDDGKIHETRQDIVKITGVIPYSEIDKETKALWQKEVKQCYWLYKEHTTHFIKGRLIETKEDVVFVRCINDGWFSLG